MENFIKSSENAFFKLYTLKNGIFSGKFQREMRNGHKKEGINKVNETIQLIKCNDTDKA